MVFSHFTVRLLIRLGFLVANLVLLSYMAIETGYVVATMLVGFLAIGQVWGLMQLVNRTNQELTRFLNAIRYEDFLQTFSIEHLGSSFADLNEAFDDVIVRFRQTRSAKEMQARYLKALVEHVPVAVVAIHGDDGVEFLNNAARRLLNATGRKPLKKLDELGPVFLRDMAQTKAGERKLTRIESDGVQRQLIMSTTQIAVAGDVQRLISLQDIQSELDATELSAWQDMVRVLSHEIMNSITPIASLAITADDLVDDLDKKTRAAGEEKDELIGDIHDAIRTVARRSENLMDFVKSYRQLTQMPPPKMARLPVAGYLERFGSLMGAEWKGRGIALHVGQVPEGLILMADENLIDQVIINLLRNAADAASANDLPQVWLSARLSSRGAPVIEIADNGAGIDSDLQEKIFLPFFTTKAEGSGIGLSLARQVMLVHKGSISVSPRADGGADGEDGTGSVFQLTF